MVERVGLTIVDVEFNKVNGGSFSVMAANPSSPYDEDPGLVERLLRDEEMRGLGTVEPYEEFSQGVVRHRDQLCELIRQINARGETIIGYGASTKGNVVLQFCNLTESDIPFIAEVNEQKFGRYTPGSHIPIIPEAEARAMKPDYLLVMPWHFKEYIVEKERGYMESGGKLIFPLPSLEVVSN